VSSALSGNVVVWATGITARAIRFYISRGLLPPPEFRGNATRYGREHFLRLLAIRKFRREDRMGLEAIRRRLDSLDPAALEQFAPPAPAVAQTATAGLVAPPAATYKRESWERLALLPGLELLVRADASPLVRRLVQEIHDHCVGPRGATAGGVAVASAGETREPATATPST